MGAERDSPGTVTVVYATAERQVVQTTACVPGSTIESAIRACGILEQFPAIDLAHQAVGIFGERRSLATPVAAGDRIEIYRPLAADPKEARRRRAAARKRGR